MSELPIPAEAVSVMYDSLAKSGPLKDVTTIIAGLRAEDRPKYENAIKGAVEDAFRKGLEAMGVTMSFANEAKTHYFLRSRWLPVEQEAER